MTDETETRVERINLAKELDQTAGKLRERANALSAAASAILRLDRDRGMMADTEAMRRKALDLLSAETP